MISSCCIWFCHSHCIGLAGVYCWCTLLCSRASCQFAMLHTGPMAAAMLKYSCRGAFYTMPFGFLQSLPACCQAASAADALIPCMVLRDMRCSAVLQLSPLLFGGVAAAACRMTRGLSHTVCALLFCNHCCAVFVAAAACRTTRGLSHTMWASRQTSAKQQTCCRHQGRCRSSRQRVSGRQLCKAQGLLTVCYPAGNNSWSLV